MGSHDNTAELGEIEKLIEAWREKYAQLGERGNKKGDDETTISQGKDKSESEQAQTHKLDETTEASTKKRRMETSPEKQHTEKKCRQHYETGAWRRQDNRQSNQEDRHETTDKQRPGNKNRNSSKQTNLKHNEESRKRKGARRKTGGKLHTKQYSTSGSRWRRRRRY